MFPSNTLSRMRSLLLLCTLLTVLASCNNGDSVTVGNPYIDKAAPIAPNTTIGVSVPVTATGDTSVNYEWTAEKGSVKDGQGSTAIIYQAPAEPGLYKISVKVSAGRTTYIRDIFVTVEQAVAADLPRIDAQPPIVAQPAADAQPPAVAQPAADVQPPDAAQPPVLADNMVTITNLVDGQQVSFANLCVGTVTDPSALKGKNLWLVVYPHTSKNWHPQRPTPAPAPIGPIQVDTQGMWQSDCYFGVSPTESIGETFDIYAVIADNAGSNILKTYLENASASNRYPGITSLPNDVEPVGQVKNLERKLG
jgi:hypothetical protein